MCGPGTPDQHAFVVSDVGAENVGFAEDVAGDGQEHAEGFDKVVLPEERLAGGVVAAANHARVVRGELIERLDHPGEHLDVVVHKPQPLGAGAEGELHAAGETAGAAHIRGQAFVVDRHSAGGNGAGDHVSGVVVAGVVHHHDPVRARAQAAEGLEQVLQEVGTVVGDDDGKQVFCRPSCSWT